MISYTIDFVLFGCFVYLLWRQETFESNVYGLVRNVTCYLCVENDVTMDEMDEKAESYVTERLKDEIADIVDDVD